MIDPTVIIIQRAVSKMVIMYSGSPEALLSNVVITLCYNYTRPCFLHISQMLIHHQDDVSWLSLWTSLDKRSNSGNFWENIQLKFETTLSPVKYFVTGQLHQAAFVSVPSRIMSLTSVRFNLKTHDRSLYLTSSSVWVSRVCSLKHLDLT